MKILTFVILISYFFSISAQQAEWKKVKDSESIAIFTRPVKGSALNEFKAITILNTRIEVVGEILRDINSYTQWVADVIESKILSKANSENMTIYLLQKVPWPVDNREMILKVTTNTNFKIGRSFIQFVAIEYPAQEVKKSTVRITDMNGSYLLEYLDREHTRVTYTVRSNPGGSLPASLANMAAEDLPFRTMKGIKKMILLPKYTNLAEQSEDKRQIEEMIKAGFLK